MTNNPDAYTLAAQAAADRARAEAAQGQGTPGGPGLQSPMRKLSKIPGARWVLSAVLLAAGSALAVDYLNTPLRAWLQYHAPVPGAGGSSIAAIAAKESAAPQAKIEQEIVQPAGVKARSEAYDNAQERATNNRAHVGEPITIHNNLKYYPINGIGNMIDGTTAPFPSWSDLKEMFGGVDYTTFTSEQPATISSGSFSPFVLADGITIATVKEPQHPKAWVFGKFDDGSYGAITLDDYKRLSR